MKTIFKLSWRNMWRSKRRTYITSASIFLAVMLSSLIISIQQGAWDKMVDNVVNFYYGYAQIHKQGYWEEKTIDEAFEIKPNFDEIIAKNPHVKSFVPRIESFALAASDSLTSGVLVVGTDPEEEHQITQLKERVVKGKYLSQNGKGILIGAGVAEKLKVDVGDTLVLISQGYHGVNAAGKYPIEGLVKFGSPELNKQMVYLSLKTAQYLYDAEGLATTLTLQIKNSQSIGKAIQTLKKDFPEEEYEIMRWEELMPELVEAQEIDEAGNYVFLFILYLIISFGIFGTILMMTKEREYEFGVLTSIGMSRWKLFISVWIEIIMIGIIGALLGIVLSFPVTLYFNLNPIDLSNMEEMAQAYENFGFEPIFPAKISFLIYFNQAIIVFVITSILAIYPLSKIMKLKPVEAMRH